MADDRDCNKCIWNATGGYCAAWDCEFISRAEAVAAVREKREKQKREAVDSLG